MHVTHATSVHDDGLESTSKTLKFTASEEHFKHGIMRIRCTSTLSPRSYPMSNEIVFTAEGLPHQSSGLHLKKSVNQGEMRRKK